MISSTDVKSSIPPQSTRQIAAGTLLETKIANPRAVRQARLMDLALPVSNPTTGEIAVAGLIAGLFVAVFAWRSRNLLVRLIWAVVALCILVPSGILTVGMNPWLVDARYRTYRLFYWSIQKGMTRDEVLALMNRTYPAGEDRLRPIIVDDSGSKLGFFMNPENAPEPDREGISVKMDDGRVVGKDYSRD
jgi:hypothetical protein